MERGERLVVAAVLAALYLKGSPFGRVTVRKRWCLVRDALLSDTPTWKDVHTCLRSRGLFDEAQALDPAERLDWGLQQLESGRALTAVCHGYPERWTKVLGAAAPPAAWLSGVPPIASTVSVVGKRTLAPQESEFAGLVGTWVVESGNALLSGGAIGADSLAAGGALIAGGDGRIVVVLPCGLKSTPLHPQLTYLSVCEPCASFSTAAAMERNALIYAASPLAVVVKSGFKNGGTWLGATDALRRKLCRVAVKDWPEDQAVKALCALGAVSLSSKAEFLGHLHRPDDLDTDRLQLFA